MIQVKTLSLGIESLRAETVCLSSAWRRAVRVIAALMIGGGCVFWLPIGQTAEFPIAGSSAVVISGLYEGVTTDLFDVGNGLTIMSSTPALSSSYAVRQMFGAVGSGNEPKNTLFASVGSGNAATVTFETSRPVLLEGMMLGLGQDFSNTYRGVSAFRLEGIDTVTGQATVLSQGSLAGNYATTYRDGAISVRDSFPVPYYGSRYRFTAVERNGGLRVMELDGLGVVPQPINVATGQPSQTALGIAVLNSDWEYIKIGKGDVILTQIAAFGGRLHVMEGGVVLSSRQSLAQSRVTLYSAGALSISNSSSSVVQQLSIHAGGLVDLAAGSLSVATGMTPEIARANLINGRGNGSWNGRSGITSSIASMSGGTRTVGWLEGSDGAITLSMAAAGDSNLDWSLDILDVANLLGGGKMDSGLTATWAEGDFNYDGFADITDIADFMSSGLFNAGPYNAPAGTTAAVPEPSTYATALAGIACGGLSMWRRRMMRD